MSVLGRYRASTALYTCRQTKTADLERENDKAAMQKKDHVFLEVERGTEIETD